MAFASYYPLEPGKENVFVVQTTPIKYGPGCVAELGAEAKAMGLARVALFTDRQVLDLAPAQAAIRSLQAAGVDVTVYDRTEVEPTDISFQEAADFAVDGDFDGFVSIGGGSVIDTAKAANLFASHPAELLTYVNKPIGQGVPVPGPLRPHIACPTTSGTGSECTGVAVFDLLSQHVKTGISSRFMKPNLALVDPEFTYSLPPMVVAATGFDVLTHAIESYTAIRYTAREKPADPALRPPYQGANPHSDLGSMEAIRMGGRYLLRAVQDPEDREARNAMMYAATMAGISFGNAGVHIPHAMSYSVAGMIRDYHPEGWPGNAPICPHGLSVVINAPAAFRFTGDGDPQRHLAAAEALGADISGAQPAAAGAVLSDKLIELMKAAGLPNGLSGMGYGEADIPGLVKGAIAQQRLLVLAPKPVGEAELAALYADAMTYW
ncbi:hydroxyacid-oxoacid transhydrogenase [Marinibaculum pumilum]|uniref:hydroxyacid-oxoacid transhydrogenase n=1 Tax=Marinibaculum pumilum TaxID=1766165 RepID=A0ABV7KV20_9PROT